MSMLPHESSSFNNLSLKTSTVLDAWKCVNRLKKYLKHSASLRVSKLSFCLSKYFWVSKIQQTIVDHCLFVISNNSVWQNLALFDVQQSLSNYILTLFIPGFFGGCKVCSLLEWCFIISIDTCWDWFQRTYVLITA